MVKKLYRSEDNKIFAGVIGGVGEYFDIDPTILRLAYILITIMTAFIPAALGYIIACFVVPQKPLIHHMDHTEPHKHEHNNHTTHEHHEHKAEETKAEEKKEETI